MEKLRRRRESNEPQSILAVRGDASLGGVILSSRFHRYVEFGQSRLGTGAIRSCARLQHGLPGVAVMPGTVAHFPPGPRCNRRWLALVEALADGELSVDDAGLVRLHLDMCRECRVHLTDTQHIDALAAVALEPAKQVPSPVVAIATWAIILTLAAALWVVGHLTR